MASIRSGKSIRKRIRMLERVVQMEIRKEDREKLILGIQAVIVIVYIGMSLKKSLNHPAVKKLRGKKNT